MEILRLTDIIDVLVNDVASSYNVDAEDMSCKQKAIEVTMARDVCFYIMYNVLGMTYLASSKALGYRGHDMALRAVRRVDDILEENTVFSLLAKSAIKKYRGLLDEWKIEQD
jgi:chromosomal replication initiation ATPase DnaA